MDNILKKSIGVTCEDFLKGVFGERSKPEWVALATLFSDISKVFGGKGMEGMVMGRDGSTGEIRMGHDFVCVSLVGRDYPEALPVNVKLGRGRKSHDELLDEAIGAVMAQTGGEGWIVEDRGMDGMRHIRERGETLRPQSGGDARKDAENAHFPHFGPRRKKVPASSRPP